MKQIKKLVSVMLSLAMVFAIEKINKDPNILFNMSLGFHVFNADFTEMKAMKSSMVCSQERAPQFLTTAAGLRRLISWLQ